MRASFIVLVLCMVGRVAAQQPGTLDSSFSDNGWLMFDGYDSTATPNSPAVVFCAEETPDLGVLLGFKQVVNGTFVVRLMKVATDGSLDQAFGNGGVVTSSTLGVLKSLLVRPDGRIVLVGKNTGAVFPDSLNISVEGYTASGELDDAFGVGGRFALKPPGPIGQLVDDAVLGPDGKIFIGGSQWTCRLDATGALDLSFGSMGWFPFAGHHIRFTPQGKIRSLGLGMTEFDYDGSEQAFTYFHSYCNPGSWEECLYQVHEINNAGVSLGCAGFHYQGFPGECGSSGYMAISGVYTNLSGTSYANTLWQGSVSQCASYGEYISGYLGDIAADPFGKSYVALCYTGTNYATLPAGWVIRRHLTSGSMDQSFGVHPTNYWHRGVFTTFDGIAPTPRATFVQADGKLVVAGTIGDSIYVARYHATPDPRTTLSLRVFLGGAYDSTTFLMRDDLRQQGLVPSLQPFDAAFFSPANGVGQWATPQHVLAVEGDSAVVDWVWLELLSAADSSNVMATRVGLLHRNGWVTSADGHSPIDFSAGAGSYFVRARHRNHLGVTTSQAVTLGPSVTTLDLTDPATSTFGTDAQNEINGVRMLWPGDANSDGAVKYLGPFNDRDRILLAIGGNTPTATLPGYRTEDVNLDGVTKYVGVANDRDIILQTNGGSVTAVRVEQRP